MADSQTWQNFLSVQDVACMADTPSLVSIAIQSQYANSRRIKALADMFQKEIDSTPYLETVLRLIATPDTAQGIFLDWLGARVQAPRTVTIKGVETKLDDDFYRFLIFYKAAANVSNDTVETLNTLLTRLIGLPVFVIDNQDMTISVRVLGKPTDLQIVILQSYGLLTRGAGVGYNILIQDPNTAIFGFNGSKLMPFEQGVFNLARELVPMITS